MGIAHDLSAALLIGGATVLTSLLLANLPLTIQAFVVLWTLFVAIITALFLIDNQFGRHGSVKASLGSSAAFASYMVIASVVAQWPLLPNSVFWWISILFAFLALGLGYTGRLYFGEGAAEIIRMVSSSWSASDDEDETRSTREVAVREGDSGK